MAWTFEQSTGKFYDADMNLVSTGYAGGNCGKNPEGVNNPDMQNTPLIGPLPQGTYTLGEPVPQSKLGVFAIPLIPDPSNNMYGRSDFYLHGDTTPSGNASEGCIIQPRTTRDKVWESDDHTIVVIGAIT